MFPIQPRYSLLPYLDVILKAESDGVVKGPGQGVDHPHHLPVSQSHSGQVSANVTAGS